MAKGDEKRARSRIDEQRTLAQDTLDRFNTRLTDRYHEDVPRYQNAADAAGRDYADIMGRYKALSEKAPVNVGYSRSPELQSALQGYQGFANTGGFSPQDIANMRARAISPIRSTYANAQNEIARQRNLQGGYSPNATAALSRMGRSVGGQIADQTTDVEARLAEMRQQGQLAGLGGLGGLAVRDLELGQQAQLANAAASRDYANVLHGMSNLYGTTPGMANMFRDQVNQTTQGFQNQAALQNQLGLGLIQGQNQAAGIPGVGDVALNRIGQVGQIAGSFAGIPGIPGIGGGGSGYGNPIGAGRTPGYGGEFYL